MIYPEWGQGILRGIKGAPFGQILKSNEDVPVNINCITT
jgi:hypothetical protein